MKKNNIIILFLSASLLYAQVGNRPLTGQGVINGKDIEKEINKKNISPQEMSNMENIVCTYYRLMNKYAMQVKNNGNFVQTADSLSLLFNTYGEDMETRVYNDIPLLLTAEEVDTRLSVNEMMQKIYTRKDRYVTDNIEHVLTSIEAMFYVDNVNSLEFIVDPINPIPAPFVTKLHVLSISDNLKMPDLTMALVSELVKAKMSNGKDKIIAGQKVFTFRNGKIESIVPAEQTRYFRSAINCFNSGDYFSAFRLLEPLLHSGVLALNPLIQRELYAILSKCYKDPYVQLWCAMIPEPGLSSKASNEVADQYLNLVKMLDILYEIGQGNNKYSADEIFRNMSSLSLHQYETPFSEGLMPYRDVVSGHVGYVNKKGDYAIKSQFVTGSRFIGGYAAVLDASTYKWGLIDKNGQYVVTPRYVNLTMDAFSNAYSAFDGTHYGCLNTAGNICIPFIYDNQVNFVHGYGYAACCRNGEWGVVSIEGKEIVPCQFKRPIAGVYKKGNILYYIIDTQTYSVQL